MRTIILPDGETYEDDLNACAEKRLTSLKYYDNNKCNNKNYLHTICRSGECKCEKTQ